ncbi:hypothetical protein [Burkholderia sp. Ac-20365]|jgi:hypothetical protein|uniref:hypothetical protein n=1 Tax=Burkholderia sp. Ac-20365 TaxID=2703897 RepID=UPI00197C2963|nr:hypothetical protein [Burkholderia sp. Ac-20365]MBN3765981.1 hypothetical protein [Burkholderia sp. Ac-20365]
MLRLRFFRYKSTAETVTKANQHSSVIAARQILHRWCVGLAVTAGVVGLLAISLGFATFGISIYIAAILPFAFFS